jgi:hypothetical protein
MRTLCKTLSAAWCVLALGVPAARAQQQQAPDQQQQAPDQQQPAPNQGTTPIPAYRSPFASAAGDEDADSQNSTPDNRALSGAQDLSPVLMPTRSYWQPQINAFGIFESNPGQNPGNTAWSGGAALSGHVDLYRISGNSNLSVSYTGGATFSTASSVGNGVVQDLSFADKITFRRSRFSILDRLDYSPGSSFGFGGLGGLAGSGSSGLGSVFGSGQTILTGEGQELLNSFVVELDTDLTPRASLTLVGGDYLAHSFTSGLLNSTDPNARVGYNYLLTRKDTIALIYTFSGYRYSNSDQSFDTHTAQVSYGRMVSGRVAFQIAAGPQIVIAQIPFSVSGGSSGSGSGTGTASNATTLNWSLNTSLTWTGRRNNFGVTYYHGANNGSGVLAGAISDTVSASLQRASSRTFSSGLAGGYSRSEGVLVGTTTVSNQEYDYWYGSASLSHPVGRTLGLTLSYTVQYQVPHSAACVTGVACGTSILTNLIAFGVGWHQRPLVF